MASDQLEQYFLIQVHNTVLSLQQISRSPDFFQEEKIYLQFTYFAVYFIAFKNVLSHVFSQMEHLCFCYLGQSFSI